MPRLELISDYYNNNSLVYCDGRRDLYKEPAPGKWYYADQNDNDTVKSALEQSRFLHEHLTEYVPNSQCRMHTLSALTSCLLPATQLQQRFIVFVGDSHMRYRISYSFCTLLEIKPESPGQSIK
eukprot:PhM_4_TR17433/c0_g1_i3/m.25324